MSTTNENYINSINLNAETDFPYLVLEVVNDRSYPRNPGFQVMHWHEDLQFIYLFKGAIEVRTLDSAVQLQEGQGIFINQNVVHLVSRTSVCHYNSFIFPESFLSFYFASPARKLAGSQQLPLYPFTPGTAWHDRSLSILQKLSALEKNKTEFYEYEVLVLLATLWLEMQKHLPLPKEEQEHPVQQRMQSFLRYIQNHYSEDLSLDDLSKSGHVSKSECLRCFKLCLKTTPYQYLTEFRLSKAAELLRETNLPIGEIATVAGFHQMSHFGKCFREKTGVSPREYRKNCKR